MPFNIRQPLTREYRVVEAASNRLEDHFFNQCEELLHSDKPWEVLQTSCKQHNAALIEQLRDDPHADVLLALTQEDAEKGRMTRPLPFEDFPSDQVRLQPRFGVEQVKADERIKLRRVDHMSCSQPGGVNCFPVFIVASLNEESMQFLP